MQPPAHGVAGSKTVNADDSIKVQRLEIKNFLLHFLDDEAPLVQKLFRRAGAVARGCHHPSIPD